MSATIRCPHCNVKLLVDDDMIGTKVECEECDTRFVAEVVAGKASGESQRKLVADTPRSRRDDRDDDDDDDRPLKRRSKRRPKPVQSSTNAAPMIFGSLLVVMLIGVSIGLYWMFGFGSSPTTSTPAGAAPAPRQPANVVPGGFRPGPRAGFK